MQKQQLKLKTTQKLSPSQIQLMKLIELPTLAFEERVTRELEENLVLEESFQEEKSSEEKEALLEEEGDLFPENNQDDSLKKLDQEDEFTLEDFMNEDEYADYKSSSYDYEQQKKDPMSFIASKASFLENLIEQLGEFSLNEEDFLIAKFIISSIDEDGYLRRELDDLVDDLAIVESIETSTEKLEHLLSNYIHKLEPYGIGARNPRETILIQLKNKEQTPLIKLSFEIIENAFEEFHKKHYEKIKQRFSLSSNKLNEVLKEIEKLSPRATEFYRDESQQINQIIIPDFILQISNGQFRLSLDGRNAPKLTISTTYSELFENYKESVIQKKEQRKVKGFIKEKITQATLFLEAIKQRQETLLLTMGAILDYQKEYFLSGDEKKLKPMTLKSISEKIKMDVSTISRVASQKYIYTPYGTFLIKNFFSESIFNQKGEEISTLEVKKVLQELISCEDKKKPLSDEKIVDLLKAKGYVLARRTVAKYREQLGIAVARLRKKLIED